MDRHDAVLLAIPVLALGGLAVETAAASLGAPGPVEPAARRLPLVPLGFVAALAVIVRAVTRHPKE